LPNAGSRHRRAAALGEQSDRGAGPAVALGEKSWAGLEFAAAPV